ncbi:hypothetical protein WK56_29795 [Burkholderia ubonensis]|uniref:hypothetical protein n=1 Tax=Burkholderia ubonensis TaxID=101571 RepID=UPI000751C10D|nr:hypothetical protein [Burkholderia ubonensis]KVT66464.1 hypothetical protein WK56_29795 [Burkholderia ubonensis]KVX96693.1 hypothetical protein WL11_26405 [Burkholderia ubonensis]
MTDAFQNLMNLRTFPRQVADKHIFYLKNFTAGGPQNGYRAKISATLVNGINEMTVAQSEGGADYFFPYIWEGTGNVAVGPVNGIAEGTIVVTGGMNGCALEVTTRNDQFVFYHDKNGYSMGKVRNAGTTVCRITSRAYWPNEFERIGQRGQMPLVQFICVYRHSCWHVLSFGLYIDNHRNVTGGFEPVGGRYRGHFNDNIKLMQA